MHAPHCHFTFTIGAYRSPWYWPTQEAAQHAGESLPSDHRLATDAVLTHPVHVPNCACADTPEKEPADARHP